MNPNLSTAQFGPSPSSTPLHAPHYDMGEGPLPYTSSTNTSAGAAAAWRKPRGLLSLTKATFGSVFKPFG